MKKIILILMTVLVAVSTSIPVFAEEYPATPEVGDQYDIMTADYLTSPVEGFPDFYYTGLLGQWHFLVFYSSEYENYIQIRYNATPTSIMWDSADNSLKISCSSFANFYTYQLSTDETTGTEYWAFLESNTVAEKTYAQVSTLYYSGDDSITNEEGAILFPEPLQTVCRLSLEQAAMILTIQMITLAATGVFFLASLVSLVIFGKVLKSFQVR